MKSIVANASAHALTLLQTPDTYDAIILDLHLLQLDSLDLVRSLHQKGKAATVILLVSLTDNGIRERTGKLGVKSVLCKPIKQQQLLTALYETVSGRDGTSGQETATTSFAASSHLAHIPPLRILLAEDNLVNQKVAVRILTRLGFSVTVAANGLEALQAVRREGYDLVFMDIQMPEMDGLEATRCIRLDEGVVQKPYIIAMTAAATQLDREKCLEAGMDDFVAKPVRMEDISQALERFVLVSQVEK
jgi:CheY-like chemotaxis protein